MIHVSQNYVRRMQDDKQICKLWWIGKDYEKPISCQMFRQTQTYLFAYLFLHLPVRRGQWPGGSSNGQPSLLGQEPHSSSWGQRSPIHEPTGQVRRRPEGPRSGETGRTWHSGCDRWARWYIGEIASSIFL